MSPVDPYPIEEVVCVIVEKVFFSCQQRECFENFCIDLPNHGGPFTFVDIRFLNGVIVPSSIIITPLEDPENFARAQFTVQIPFTLRVRNECGQIIPISGTLPDVRKDIVLYFPPTRDEFDFNLRVETRSELLTQPVIRCDEICITVGTFLIVKVTGLVQLSIPAFGYCPPPDECIDFPVIPDNPCIDFFEREFPDDFFPPQLETNSVPG